MLNRLDLNIVLAGATMLIGGVPALAHGGGSLGHSSHSPARVGASTKSIGPTSTRMSPGTRSTTSPALATRMLVTTVPMMTASPKTSVAADPPAAGAPLVTTSPSTMSGLGVGGGGSPLNLSQFNTGAQDVATPGVSAPMTTDITTTSTITAGSQILGANGVLLPNVGTATSGMVAQAPTGAAIASAAIIGTQGEVIATSGGSSITGGATGKDMPECMSAWDKTTHIAKQRWREICARTLKDNLF